MHPILRIFGIAVVFVLAAVSWLALGGVTSSRSGGQLDALEGRVADLWGSPQVQQAPAFAQEWVEMVRRQERVTDAATGAVSTVDRLEPVLQTSPADPSRTRIAVGLHLDQRQKGLTWFPLYDVDFAGTWTYTHTGAPRDLRLTYTFPDSDGVYDGFRFVVDGTDRAKEVRPANGAVSYVVPVQPGQVVTLEVAYASRGMREWSYRPTESVGRVDDFALTMTTDFDAIDFPKMTMSPSTRTPAGAGWQLDWTFASLVSGYGIGMTMPEHIQPGALAADMSFSAPLPLGLFFLWIFVLGLLRGVEIHPINYLFIGAAFFSFDLLFAYTADHLPVEWAFTLASVVSVGLVASYLRLVVGARFALVEAGIAQVLYQVGFSLAHFKEGFTGLTITVLGVLTLFALMQLTGRIQWSQALAPRKAPAAA